jgi:hypothetical protein
MRSDDIWDYNTKSCILRDEMSVRSCGKGSELSITPEVSQIPVYHLSATSFIIQQPLPIVCTSPISSQSPKILHSCSNYLSRRGDHINFLIIVRLINHVTDTIVRFRIFNQFHAIILDHFLFLPPPPQ